jgi:tetratricopeptide (TPR) repeat protein/tRNA A-37 threonylcarbamoyl transferase component Bud32
MTPEEWSRVESVYLDASAIAVSERCAFLDRVCGGEPELRRKVEGLLEADVSRGDFLALAPLRLAADLFERGPEWPEFIGPYRILGVLGEGGMGTVYRAEQENPHRMVALKVIRAAMMSRDVQRRFEREAEALGRLQHVGIAQIYQAGTAGNGGGQPYFAMELIRGRPLRAYAAETALSTSGRLELMAKVCDAVHHAHQRGILHRDLKPGNILVDDSGQPKILDFGVARILDSDSQATRQTDLGQLIGTLDYMSPEQLLGDPLAMDVRSDIYSLGVILYELLAGRLPYEGSSRALPELARAIREDDAEPLSAVQRSYRGDVETIVSKALEKQRERRYGSAAELAGDIRRHLAGEPILAMPASASYRASKFYRRYRTGVLASGVFVLVILGFGIALAGRAARNARDRDTARTERASAEAVVAFLQNDVLAQADGGAQTGPARDPNLRVREALDRAAVRIQGKFERQPLVEASIRQTIGETYDAIGVLPSAAEQLEKALAIRRRVLGAGHPDTLTSMVRLGETYRAQGKGRHGEPLFREAVATGTRVLGDENPIVMNAMTGLAGTCVALGKPNQAEELYGKVLGVRRRVLGPASPDTIAAMSDLAVAYSAQGKFGQAEKLYLQVIEIQSNQPHPGLVPYSNLGNLYVRQGMYREAEPYLRKAMDEARRTMNEEHPFRLYMMESVGSLYRDTGRFDEAEALFRQVWNLRRRVIGEENRNTLSDVFFLGDLYCTEGKWAEGEKMLLQALTAQRRVLSDEDRFTVRTMAGLSLCYLRQEKLGEAEPWAAKAAEIRTRQLGPANPLTLEALCVLADLKLRLGMLSEADSILKDACAVASKDWQGYYCQSLLGASLAARRSFPEAEPLLQSGYQGMVRSKSSLPAGRLMHIASARVQLARLYKARGKPAESRLLENPVLGALGVSREHD